MARSKNIIPPSEAALRLFAAAKAHIESAIEIQDAYNEIAEALSAMGYGDEPPMHGQQPVYRMNVDWFNCTMQGPEDLDYFVLEGPKRRPIPMTGRQGNLQLQKRKIASVQGWQCFYCGIAGDEDRGPDGRVWHIDHYYPVAKGGDSELDNLVLSCATCNLDKKAMLAADYFRKLHQEKVSG